MTMDIIDKRIYSCNEAICKNIESLQANERGLLSQNILSQLRNFLECVFLKIYVASGNSLIENEYQNIKNAIKFINTLQGKYRFLNQFHKLLQISVSHYTLDPDSSERLMLKYYEYLLRIKTFMKDNYGIELLENLHKFPLNTDTAFTQYYEAIDVDTNWKVRCILIEKSSIHNLLQNYYKFKIFIYLVSFFVFP